MRIIFSLILILNIYSSSSAQNGCDNMIKYWNYRNRLQYFVVPGSKQGESEIMGIRNPGRAGDPNRLVSEVGQHGVYFGYYLSMLATEYKLLSDNNQTIEAAKTLEEIDLALNQFRIFMDFEAEGFWNEMKVENGFFVRDNMPCNFMDTTSGNSFGFTINGEKHLDLLNKNLGDTNVWDNTNETFKGFNRGHPGYINYVDSRTCDNANPLKEPMSIDEAIGVLQGLALVYKLCPANRSVISKDIACNIIRYIQNNPPQTPGVFPWFIYKPNGVAVPDSNGGDALAYQIAFERVSRYFDNNCLSLNNASFFRLLWQAQQFFSMKKIFINSMSATLAAIGKSWHIGFTINVGCCNYLCPSGLCLQIPVYYNSTGWGIKNVQKKYNNETFYLLLYEVLQNKTTKYLKRSKVEAQLNSAPCEGPYDYQYGNVAGPHAGGDTYGGWASSYRWRKESYEQNGIVPYYEWVVPFIGIPHLDTIYKNHGNYNGLDYMICYNLYHIIYGGPSYENYNSRHLSGLVNSPINYVAFDSLFSVQEITDTTPTVNYKAGEIVNLKPEFHAFPGSDFHAFIAPTACGASIVNDTTSIAPNYPLELDSALIDTLPCIPGTSNDTLRFNGIDGDTASNLHYQWWFGNAIPETSTDPNPTVVLQGQCGQIYRAYVILSVDSTDSTDALVTDTLVFQLYRECCDSAKKKISIKPNDLLLTDYQVNVYPNPTSDIFNVSCSDNTISFSTEVSDVIGNIIYNVKNANGMVPFDLSLKPKGIYFVRINTSDGKTHYRKIIYN